MPESVIVGGGIGGLTAALCLARIGWDVTVLEQSAAFREAGAGLQISPNAARVMEHLGLGKGLEDAGFLPRAVEMRDWQSGDRLALQPLGQDAVRSFGAPYVHVHRRDLLDLLLKAASAAGVELRTGVRVTDVEEGERAAALTAEGERFVADLVVGADGIHSSVQAALFGAQPARFTGNVAFRGLVPAADLPPGLIRPVATAWLGPGCHFVHYFVRGGELVNCVCVVEQSEWQEESWTEVGSRDELHAAFSGWHETVTTLISSLDETALYRWALFDREPMNTWSRGRVTLLGDACHPTLPFMAQGAAMAIEDAAVLSRCLESADVAAALVQYEGLRRARTAFVQRGSRRNARIYHLSGIAARLRNLVLDRAGGSVMSRLYGYDPLSD